jgi:hypothetical protein
MVVSGGHELGLVHVLADVLEAQAQPCAGKGSEKYFSAILTLIVVPSATAAQPHSFCALTRTAGCRAPPTCMLKVPGACFLAGIKFPALHATVWRLGEKGSTTRSRCRGGSRRRLHSQEERKVFNVLPGWGRQPNQTSALRAATTSNAASRARKRRNTAVPGCDISWRGETEGVTKVINGRVHRYRRIDSKSGLRLA